MKLITTMSLLVIAACHLSFTLVVYEADGGGTNVFFGNFGYHIEGK